MALVPTGAPRDAGAFLLAYSLTTASTCFLLRNNHSPAITIGPSKPSRPGYGLYVLICKLLSFRTLSGSILFCIYELGIRNPMQSFSRGIPLRSVQVIIKNLEIPGQDKKSKGISICHPMFAAIWVDYDDTETEC
uniref:Uncharacterized protein n=1 Tax=Cryptococcus bacillisporus CA1280 TaxID=1296109 RepID=A0A0D0TSS0_CRYGA|nr:hypothetical protein I312_00792 [Cryptococcus bacillisporus CA1280]